MTTRNDLQVWLWHPNVAAFLRVIREGESSQDDSAYAVSNGGSHFSDFSRHPYHGIPTTQGGKACGAYQFLGTTWAEIQAQYGLPDFTPASQDLGAVALIYRRHAMDALLAGDLDTAIALCRKEWTSLPGAAENHRYTLQRARAVWMAYGGVSQQPQAAAEPPAVQSTNASPAAPETGPIPYPQDPSPTPTQEVHVGAIAAFLPLILNAVPALMSIFGSGSEVATRNQKAAEVVAKAAIEVTNSVNLQQATEALQNDPAARAALLSHDDVMTLMESGGGGIEGARKFSSDPANLRFWFNGAFYVSFFFLALVGWVAFKVLNDPTAGEGMKSQVVSAVIGFATVAGAFWLGSSRSSQAKDEQK